MLLVPRAIAGFDVAVSTRPRPSGGGDYHAVFAAPGGSSMAVAVGDVAGHDAHAAHLMHVAGRLLHRRLRQPGSLASAMEGVNHALMPRLRGGRFMTLFLAVLEAERRSLRWVSAGQAPVLAYDPVADRFGEVPGHDIPLGIDPDWRYRQSEHRGWAVGALLVVGTDGIWETRDVTGAMYGRSRLLQCVHGARQGSAAAIVGAVEADMDCFRNGRPPDDDATLLVVKAV
ncbi:MAG: PP2C family protein-serine/threonine phosphatase [Bacteroidales bacterium]